jgi:hypothetical protein
VNIADTSVWLFRSGIAIKRGVGYLLACDPKVEENSPHAKVVAIQGDKRFESWVRFNAHSICRVTTPENGVLVLCSDGFYAFFARQVHTGNLFTETPAPSKEVRFGSMRSLVAIGGRAYAAGTRGMAYRFEGPAAWTCIDSSIPKDFDAQALAGFNEEDIYAVGFRGALFHYDGKRWTPRMLPTNVNLSAALCAPDGNVYVAGHRGMLLSGRGDVWRLVGNVTEDIWGLASFRGEVYGSTFRRLFRIREDQIEAVSVAPERPRTFYQLSAADDVMWSIGETDVLSFDGLSWTRVI